MSIMALEKIKKVSKEVILKELSEEVVSIVLYGSYASGKATKYSDVDLLLITKNIFSGWRDKRKVSANLRRIFYKYGSFSVNIATIEEFKRSVQNLNPITIGIYDAHKVIYDKKNLFKNTISQLEKYYNTNKIKRIEDNHWKVSFE